MSEFNFKSQICTSREQSERLLALGLKKETADMYYSYDIICAKPYYKVMEFMNGCVPEDIFPAWSLHRLIEMGFNSLALLEDADDEDEIFFMAYKNPFESMLEMFEWLIKEGYFNKEYLA